MGFLLCFFFLPLRAFLPSLAAGLAVAAGVAGAAAGAAAAPDRQELQRRHRRQRHVDLRHLPRVRDRQGGGRQPDPCGVASSDTVVTEPARTETVKTVPQGTPPRRVESSPAEAPIIPSTVLAAPKKPTPPPTPAPEATKPKPAETGTGAGTGGTGADPDTASPPAVPAPEVETPSQTPLTNPSDLKPPPAPTGTEPPVELPPKDKAADGTVYQRDARKPVLTAANASAYMRSSREGTLHWLEGKVVSSATNEAESGVRVVVANRRQTFADRVAVTDSNGHYKVRTATGP